MKLLSAEFVNYRAFENEKVSFIENEATVIYGSNGVGKSTIFYGIPFNLYGWSPWKLEDVLKSGTKKGKIVLIWEHDGIIYRSTREFDRKSTHFKLEQFLNDTEEFFNVSGSDLSTEAEAMFKRIFPVPEGIFLLLVTRLQLKKQERYSLGYLCMATPAKFYELIKEFVDTVMMEQLEQTAKDIVKELDDERIGLNSIIQTSKQTIEDMSLRPVAPKELTDLEKNLEFLQQGKEQKQLALETLKVWHEQKQKFEVARKVIQDYPEAERYYESWQPLKTLAEPKVKYDESILKEKRLKLEQNRNNQVALVESIKMDQIVLKRAENEKDSIQHSIIKNRERDYDVKSQIQSIAERVEFLKQGKCDKCGREFENAEESIQELNNKIVKLKKLMTNQEIVDDLNQRYKQSQKTVSDTKQWLESQNQEFLNLNLSISILETEIIKMEAAKEATKKWTERVEFLKTYPFKVDPDTLYKQIIQARAIEDPGEQPLRGSIGVLENEIKLLDTNIIKTSNVLNDLQTKHEQFHYHNNKIITAQSRLETVKYELERFTELVVIYGRTGAPLDMMQDFVAFLQHYSNKALSKLTHNRISMKIKTSGDKIQPVFYDAKHNNKERDFTIFSGGEQTRIALAVEVIGLSEAYEAISSVKIDTLCIDEVYGLDEDGQNKYAEALKEMSGMRSVIVGIVCFKTAAEHFERVLRVEHGNIMGWE